ncbi:TraR/DksA C4-type zinc finger protein [Psychrobacter sp. 2Y5]|uniref:TraR/DksA C4-type zinc finger protein n=1 Tax=unclassified Psychrobacter TaxID=196806 RepID=UPI003F46322D
MADDIDLAQERQDLEMAARMQIAQRFDTPSLTECDDCGEDIPSKRQSIGGVTRCVDCQNHFEGRR